MTSNHIAQGSALGFLCRVMIAPRRGKSIFLPTVTLLPCQGAVCYFTLVPQGVALGWWLVAPFQGRIRQNNYCYWSLQMPDSMQPNYDSGKTFVAEYSLQLLSKNIRILSPKNRGCWSRKVHSVKKTAIFAVFGNLLTDRRLRDCLSVNWQFTKYEFARGKVSLRERPCFVV